MECLAQRNCLVREIAAGMKRYETAPSVNWGTKSAVPATLLSGFTWYRLRNPVRGSGHCRELNH